MAGVCRYRHLPNLQLSQTCLAASSVSANSERFRGLTFHVPDQERYNRVGVKAASRILNMSPRGRRPSRVSKTTGQRLLNPKLKPYTLVYYGLGGGSNLE